MDSHQMVRREFLKKATGLAAGALAVPTLIPSSALGRDGAVAPSNRITMGCIGLGGQGTGNMRGFLGDPQVQILALCDVDRGHLEQARNAVNERYQNQDCLCTGDYREVLARPDIDTVLVCTPDHWHAVISVAAAKAGKDIYCEKPLANSVAEGRAVADAVHRYGRVLQTGSHERSRQSVRYACELVRNGRIGKLHTIRVNLPVDHGPIPPQPVMAVPEGFDYDFWLGPAPWATYTERRCHFSFRYILDYSGGEMTDRGAHIIDIAQLGHGSDDTGPVEISGLGWAPTDGLFNTFMKYKFECVYADGVKLIGESVQPRGLKFEGDKGWIFIHIHGGDLEAEPASLLREAIGPDEIQLGRSTGHHEDFLNCVKTRGVPMASAETGHRTASICHLVNIALLTGRPLKWDPKEEKVLNDPGANQMVTRTLRSPWKV